MIIDGLLQALSVTSIGVILGGVFLGIIVGIVPGIGSGVGMSLLLPLVFNIPPFYGLMLLLALWAADGYGAALSSILLNVPGGVGSVATCFDGYPMAQQGKASLAVGMSMSASMVAGIIGVVVFMVAAPPFAKLAVNIKSADYAIMGLLGMTMIGGLSGKDPIKGLISAFSGLMLSLVGTDLISGVDRYTLGTMYLYDGFNLTVVLIGLFAISSLVEAGLEGGTVAHGAKISGSVWRGFLNAFLYPFTILRSSLVGVVLGVLPGGGAAMANLMAYELERKWSKHPETFGTGAPEGVIAPEAANNSCQPAALIPTLTLGIPTTSSAAIFLGALIMYGIQPGGNLFQTGGQLVWALMWGLIIASIAYVFVGLLFTNFFVRLTVVPVGYLIPVTLVTCFIGAFTIHNNFYDVIAVFIFGVIGFIMRTTNYPIAPAVLGMVLGPVIEINFNRAMVISNGSYKIFFSSIISWFLWFLLVLVLLPSMRRSLLSLFAKRVSTSNNAS